MLVQTECTFFDVFDPTSFTKVIGQVKFDPFRSSNKWTALGFDGIRIRDCRSRQEADELVENYWASNR